MLQLIVLFYRLHLYCFTKEDYSAAEDVAAVFSWLLVGSSLVVSPVVRSRQKMSAARQRWTLKHLVASAQ